MYYTPYINTCIYRCICVCVLVCFCVCVCVDVRHISIRAHDTNSLYIQTGESFFWKRAMFIYGFLAVNLLPMSVYKYIY